jgi:uncharacterized DUF497 family protein
MMIIVWDEHKRLANLAKHGIDFADAPADYFLTAVIRPARSGRWSAIGHLYGIVAVICARLGEEGISLISVRPANHKERKLLE